MTVGELSPWSPLIRTMSLLRQRPVSASPFMKSEVAMMCLKRWSKGQSGQAMVETAIVMPLFLFMILGIVQMNLIYQARAMLKYAAYRAARVGALQSMDVQKMTDMAITTLSPVIARDSSLRPPTSGYAVYIDSLLRGVASSIGFDWLSNINFDYPLLPIVSVKICGPVQDWMNNAYNFDGQTGGRGEIDFDDPRNTFDTFDPVRNLPGTASSLQGVNGVQNFERTRLRIQVQYNHKLIIPFANWVIHRIWLGKKIQAGFGLNQKDDLNLFQRIMSMINGKYRHYELAAALGVYIFPIRQNYAFRMQSNFRRESLPQSQEDNGCIGYYSN